MRGHRGGVLNLQGTSTTLQNNVSQVQSSLNTVGSNVSVIGNKNLLNKDSVVKSIQRGVAFSSASNVSISYVNINKSILIVNGVVVDYVNSVVQYVTLNSNGIVFAYRGADAVAWQVIEFY